MTNTSAPTPIAAYRNHNAGPIITCRTGNETLTRKFAIQFAEVETADARARDWLGKISEIISQTIGPIENAKQMIYMPTKPTVIGASECGFNPIVEPNLCATPSDARLAV